MRIREAADAPSTRPCRICGAAITPFMSFGRMPHANGFLAPERLTEPDFVEPSYELAPAVCGGCGMFQLMEQPPPQSMFHDGYAYYSGGSVAMTRHFEALAREVIAPRIAGRSDPFVVEIGSNDGILLRPLAALGLRALGVEPSSNVAAVARAAGLDAMSAFFGRETAARIRAERGPADVVVGANVISHVAALPEVAAGVADLLTDDGVFVIESPYLGAVVENTAYDQIYDEHVYLFSAISVANAFAPHGLGLIDVAPLAVHGGSLRWTLGRIGRHAPTPAVAATLAAERALGLDRAATYDAFRARCEDRRDALAGLLRRLRAEGARIVGYGATAKSATVLNYARIGPEVIDCIVDSTPIKQGMLTPGMRVPVRAPAAFRDPYPDYALLLAWNHAAEILAKEPGFRAAGGRWIRFAPTLAVDP